MCRSAFGQENKSYFEHPKDISNSNAGNFRGLPGLLESLGRGIQESRPDLLRLNKWAEHRPEATAPLQGIWEVLAVCPGQQLRDRRFLKGATERHFEPHILLPTHLLVMASFGT